MDKFKPFRKLSKRSKIIYYAEPQIEDAQALNDYLIRSIPHSPYILSRISEFKVDLKTQQERIENIKGEGQFAINAWYDGEIIGHLNFWSANNKSRVRHQGEFGITLDPRFRGEGIGRILINQLIEWAKQDDNPIRKINLGVISENKAAFNLYKSLGFKEEGYLKNALLLDTGRYVDEYRCALFL